MKSTKQEAVVILHNIRSAHNVGSLFRTADAAGVKRIFITGYTPTPTDSFGRANKEITKTALGAEQTISWKQQKTVVPVINKLKGEGFYVVAIEQNKQAINYRKIPKKEKIAFVLGNEVDGVDAKTLTLVDAIAEIPMKGEKESLNVSAAGAIALFQILGI